MKKPNVLTILAIFLLSACALSNFKINESHWQFQELPNQCEIRSTYQNNPQIVWRAWPDHQGRLQTQLLIQQNYTQLMDVKDETTAKFTLNKVVFEIPLVKTSLPNQYAIDYQSLGVMSNVFVTMMAKSQTITLEIADKKYHYNNQGINVALDLWTDCFVYHFR